VAERAAGPAAPPVPVLVLAAGSGTRFVAAGGRGSKLLAPFAGRPLLAHVLDAAAAADVGPVHLVLPHALRADTDGDATLAAVLAGRGLTVIVNPRAAEGMGTSLAAGLAHLAADRTRAAGACVVLLGDQPGVDPAVVRAVVEAWARTGLPTRARYVDGPGHPVLLPRAHWPALADATEAGARALLAGTDVTEVPVATPVPTDVDVPEDLGRTGTSGGAR
jgi:molybdenum cofactor cytidylyltransferase